MKIEVGKFYKTRDGRKAWVTFTDRNGFVGITMGAVQVVEWGSTGIHRNRKPELSLDSEWGESYQEKVKVKKKVKVRTMWAPVSLNPQGEYYNHGWLLDKEAEALKYSTNVIGAVKFKIRLKPTKKKEYCKISGSPIKD